jgi:hypothetical protein
MALRWSKTPQSCVPLPIAALEGGGSGVTTSSRLDVSERAALRTAEGVVSLATGAG